MSVKTIFQKIIGHGQNIVKRTIMAKLKQRTVTSFCDERLFIFLPATNIIHDLQQLNSKQPTQKESESLLGLRKTAADKGFVICDNPASGNCMFYTLSEQLQRVKGINIPHKEIRKDLVQFLTNFPNLVRPLLV